MEQLCESQQHSSGNPTPQERDGTLMKKSGPPLPPKPKASFPAQLEGPRSKLIGMLGETFEGAISPPKLLPEFDFWILVFGENAVHNRQLINSVLKDERMRFRVLDTTLMTEDLALLEQKWLTMGHPSNFILNARATNVNIEDSALDQLSTFIKRKKRSWTQRIYIIISTTSPTDVVCNRYAGRFQKYLYVPCPTNTVNLKRFAIVMGCADPFDIPVDEKDECQSTRNKRKGCLATLFNCCNCCLPESV